MPHHPRAVLAAFMLLPCLAGAEAWAGALPQADLGVTNSNAATFVISGERSRSLVRVTNQGPAAAPAPTLAWAPAAGYAVEAVTCSPTPGTCAVAPTAAALAPGVVLPGLAAGAYYEIAIDMRVLGGPARSTAQVTAGDGIVDPVASNNEAIDNDNVIVVDPAGPDVSLTIASAAGYYVAGTPVDFTLRLGNAGPQPTSVVLVHTLPTGTRFESLVVPAGFACSRPPVGAAGTVSCNAVAMPAGTAMFSLRIGTAEASGPIVLQAGVSSLGGFEPDSTNNFATLTLGQFVVGVPARQVVPSLSAAMLALLAGLVLLGARRGGRC